MEVDALQEGIDSQFVVWLSRSCSSKSDGLSVVLGFSVPEGPNVYRTKIPDNFEAPEERNV